MHAIFSSGLKIVGGRLTEKGTYAAYITKVKKGSIADTAGHLRPGKLTINILKFFSFCSQIKCWFLGLK